MADGPKNLDTIFMCLCKMKVKILVNQAQAIHRWIFLAESFLLVDLDQKMLS